MGPLLHDHSSMEKDDPIGEPGRAQPVRDEQDCFTFGQHEKAAVHLQLRKSVKGGCRFVQHEDVGVAEVSARDHQLLPLTGR